MQIPLSNLISHIIITLLQSIGLTPNTLSLRSAFKRLQRRGINVSTVIDVGASNGIWSRKALDFVADAVFFLIEAQVIHEPALRRLKKHHPRIDFILAAAGNRNGEIFFDASDPFGGLASDTPFTRNGISVPVRTLDSLVKDRKLKPPFLLKLDTHGFEVPIFEGAAETLKRTELIIVETYNFKLTSVSLRFHEMCSFLEERGFRCIDMCEPMHRPKDGAFWQMDLFFVPAGRPEFTSNTYE